MISIIMPVYNKLTFTRAALNDLLKLDMKTHEIIVIDNASTDDTQKELSIMKDIRYFRNETNTFHAAASNQGYSLANGEYVIFLNNDIRVKAPYNWTDELIKHKDCLVSPTMGQLDEKLNFVREANYQLPGYSYLSGWMVGGYKDTWNKLDMIWNERYPFYFDDTDLSFRARETGIPLKVVPTSVIHFGKISASQLNIQSLYADARKLFIEEWKDLII